jgi:preprotein translocase subunit SecB
MAAKLHFVGHKITDLELHIADRFQQTESEHFEQSVNVQNNIDTANKRIEVIITCEVNARSKNFKVLIKIKGLFQGDQDVEEPLLTKFASQNAPAILFPFARAAVASLTAQANVPVVYLATVNFAQLKPEEEKLAP